MNTWNEILAENESDHEASLASEECRSCGTLLGNHYDADRKWIPCIGVWRPKK